MKLILKTEELAQLVIALLKLGNFPVGMEWWLWIILFFAPDLSMAGYLGNARLGAILYNVLHHKGVAAIIFVAGFAGSEIYLQVAALILWAHASFDRIWGYGLKYPGSFHHTHLGFIGKKMG